MSIRQKLLGIGNMALKNKEIKVPDVKPGEVVKKTEDGWILRRNPVDYPDIPTDQEFQIVSPNGKRYAMSYETALECLSDDPEDVAWRKRRA